MAAAALPEERRILVAVDEGEESMNALRWCLGNIVKPRSSSSADGEEQGAAAGGDTLVLVYVRPSAPVYSIMDTTASVGHMFSEEVTESMEKYSREVADAVIGKATSICKDHGNIKVQTKVSVGDARDVICELVDKLGADLLVMGSHGYGFIKRALLGSVSDHCARNANCPVLIVKRKAE